MPTADTPPPVRVYTCYMDGVLHTQTFPHGEWSGQDLDRELERQFQAWLEMTAPMAREDGRITGIRFADIT